MQKSQSQTEELFFSLFRLRNVRIAKPKPPGDIRPSGMMLLFYLWQKAVEGPAAEKGLTIKELSAGFGVTASSITQHVNPLESAGYIVRRADFDDRRIVRVSLTKKGKDLIGAARQSILDQLQDLTAFLGPEDTDAFIRILDRVYAWRCRAENEPVIKGRFIHDKNI